MANIKLLVGDDRLPIDSDDISAVSLSFLLKDIKDYGKRNSSFSKPITVLQTAATDEIFKALFNINSIGGYDVGVRVYGELQEDGITILQGGLEILEITPIYYKVILSSNNISLFVDLGTKLITGNQNPSDNVTFDASSYFHKYSRDIVRTHLNGDPSCDGYGYTYPIVGYDSNLGWLRFDLNALRPNFLKDDYKILPAIAVKQIFDKIITSNGYTYSLSTEIDEALKKMYIPFNDDYVLRAENYAYAKYYYGDASTDGYTDPYVEGDSNLSYNPYTGETKPPLRIRGFTFEDDSITGTTYDVTGGYDYIRDLPATYHQTDSQYVLPHAGTYILDVSMWLKNPTGNDDAIEWYVRTWNGIDGAVDTAIGSADVSAGNNVYLSSTLSVTVAEKSSLYIAKTLPNDTNYVELIFSNKSNLKITEVNSLLKNTYFELNTMLPVAYKQADFLNDIFKMFNAYVSVDEEDERKLIIKTYEDYYSNSSIYDWSNLVDHDSINFKPIKNSFAKNTIFTFTKDSDIYSDDYADKFELDLWAKEITNDSEFANSDNTIKLTCAPTPIILVPYSTLNNPYFFGGVEGVSIPIISNGLNFKTAWKPRILFSNTMDISSYAFEYGTDAPYVADNDASIIRWNTLLTRYNNDTSSSDNLFIGFDSKNTYLNNPNNPNESNETLYNNFYKADLESNISDYAFMLTADFKLSGHEINQVGFDDLIYVADNRIGNAFYRLNSIKNYTPGGGLSKVELIKTDINDYSYNTDVSSNIIVLGIEDVISTIVTEQAGSSIIVKYNTEGKTYTVQTSEEFDVYMPLTITGRQSGDVFNLRLDVSSQISTSGPGTAMKFYYSKNSTVSWTLLATHTASDSETVYLTDIDNDDVVRVRYDLTLEDDLVDSITANAVIHSGSFTSGSGVIVITEPDDWEEMLALWGG